MKKLFVSIVAIVLATTPLVPKSALAEQPNLQSVGNTESGDEYLLDYNSLRRNGVIVQYSDVVRYNSTHYDDQNQPSIGAYNLIRANCSTGQYQFLGGATYGLGWVVTKSYDRTSPIYQTHLYSIGARVLSTACQLTN